MEFIATLRKIDGSETRAVTILSRDLDGAASDAIDSVHRLGPNDSWVSTDWSVVAVRQADFEASAVL